MTEDDNRQGSTRRSEGRPPSGVLVSELARHFFDI